MNTCYRQDGDFGLFALAGAMLLLITAIASAQRPRESAEEIVPAEADVAAREQPSQGQRNAHALRQAFLRSNGRASNRSSGVRLASGTSKPRIAARPEWSDKRPDPTTSIKSTSNKRGAKPSDSQQRGRRSTTVRARPAVQTRTTHGRRRAGSASFSRRELQGEPIGAGAPVEEIISGPSLGSTIESGLSYEPVPYGEAYSTHDCGDANCYWGCRPCRRWNVFAEYLYLRPGNVDMVYGVEFTGPDEVLDSPTGQVGIAAIDTSSGFRVGLGYALNDCSSFVTTYSWWRGTDDSAVRSQLPNVIIPTVTDPSGANAGATSNRADASYRIEFERVEFDYRRMFRETCDTRLSYTMGLKYANLEQNFRFGEVLGVGTGLTTVGTDIDFDGFGIGFGLEGERRSRCRGWLGYAKAGASFVGGEYQATFRQRNQLGGAAVIGNNYEDYRLVSIVDAEIGFGWENQCGSLRWTVGYLVSAWFNTLTTETYIREVHERQFGLADETLTFNGLTTRLEYRF